MTAIKTITRLFQSNNVTGRLTKGIALFSIGQLLNLLIKVSLPPLFLASWGIQLYSHWLILSATIAYITFSTLGAQLYITNRLNQLYSNNQINLFVDLLNNGLMFFIAFTVFILCLLAAILPLIPTKQYLHINELSQRTINGVLLILAFQILFSFIQGMLTNVYQAIGRLPFGAILSSSILLLQLIFSVTALYAHSNIIVFAAIQVAPPLLISLYAYHNIKSSFPALRLINPLHIDWKLMRSFFKPSMNFLLIELSSALSIQGSVIVVSAILNSVAVILFTTTRTIINVTRQILGVFSHSAWPELTRLDTQKKTTDLVGVFRFTLRSTLVCTSLIVLSLHFLGQYIYEIWLHSKIQFNPTVMNLFLVYGYELAFWSCSANLLMATNNHKALSKIYLISSAIALTASYILGQSFGLSGVIGAIIASDLLIPFWIVPYLVKRHFNHFNFSFYLTELAPTLLLTLFSLYSAWLLIISIPLMVLWLTQSLSPLKKVSETTRELSFDK